MDLKFKKCMQLLVLFLLHLSVSISHKSTNTQSCNVVMLSCNGVILLRLKVSASMFTSFQFFFPAVLGAKFIVTATVYARYMNSSRKV